VVRHVEALVPTIGRPSPDGYQGVAARCTEHTTTKRPQGVPHGVEPCTRLAAAPSGWFPPRVDAAALEAELDTARRVIEVQGKVALRSFPWVPVEWLNEQHAVPA
jgi:hypothetical protein